jgi:hypothetical protein
VNLAPPEYNTRALPLHQPIQYVFRILTKDFFQQLIVEISVGLMLVFRSRDSSVGIVKEYGLDGRCSIPGRGKEFSQFHSVQIGSGAPPASYPMRTTVSGEGQKQFTGLDWTDQSFPSSAEVRNSRAIPPLPHTSSWLIKHSDNCTILCCSLIIDG